MRVTDRRMFGTVLNEMGLVGKGAEIGVAYGENAKFILDIWKGKTLYLIDPYDLAKCGTYIDGSANIDFDVAKKYMKKHIENHLHRTVLLEMTSNTAAKEIEDHSLDFVYLDGNHHNPQFLDDIINWYPKVKPGGIFAGHDYYNLNESYFKCDVKMTVDEFITTIKYADFYTTLDTCSSWWIHTNG